MGFSNFIGSMSWRIDSSFRHLVRCAGDLHDNDAGEFISYAGILLIQLKKATLFKLFIASV